MKKELDDLLRGRYPAIFAERGLSAQQSCMGRGFECEDGWFDLIDTLCEQLQCLTDQQRAPQIVAYQVKQKFGGLRFSCNKGTDEQAGMVRMAEALSQRVCEICGASGKTVVAGRTWMTRCGVHAPAGSITYKEFTAHKLKARAEKNTLVKPTLLMDTDGGNMAYEIAYAGHRGNSSLTRKDSLFINGELIPYADLPPTCALISERHIVLATASEFAVTPDELPRGKLLHALLRELRDDLIDYGSVLLTFHRLASDQLIMRSPRNALVLAQFENNQMAAITLNDSRFYHHRAQTGWEIVCRGQAAPMQKGVAPTQTEDAAAEQTVEELPSADVTKPGVKLYPNRAGLEPNDAVLLCSETVHETLTKRQWPIVLEPELGGAYHFVKQLYDQLIDSGAPEDFSLIAARQAKLQPPAWSDGLIRQTRDLINNRDFLSRDGVLHMKGNGGRAGFIRDPDFYAQRLLLVDRETQRETLFRNVEDLILAGWAID